MSDAVFGRFSSDQTSTGRAAANRTDASQYAGNSGGEQHSDWTTSDGAGLHTDQTISSVPSWWSTLLAPITNVLEHERSRWVLWTPLAFASGAAAYFGLPFEPQWPLLLAILIASIGLMIGMRHAATLTYCTCAILALAGFGFLAGKLRNESVRAPVILTETAEIKVSGFAEGIEPRAKGGSRLTLRVTDIAGLTATEHPKRVRVSSRQPLSDIKAGDHIEAWMRLRPPAAPAAPGDYDFARYAWFKGIGGVGFLTRPPEKTPPTTDTVPWDIQLLTRLGSIRAWIGARIKESLPGQTGAIATALITGERGAISEETNDAYRAAGLYHVLSISGLHMAIMGGAVFFTIRALLALFPAITLRFNIKKWAAAGAILGALAYLAISGGAFATIRSFLMIAVMFIAILLNRPALALRNVAIAAFIILLVFPESILDPGFQMSFAAVIALVAGYGEYERWRHSKRPDIVATRAGALLRQPVALLAGIVASTMFASLAVSPLALYHFNQSQHFSVLANATAMPVCNLIVMPMALAALMGLPFGLEAPPLWLMGQGIDVMTASAEWVASLPGATGRSPAFAYGAILAMAAGALLVAMVHHPVRWLGLGLFASGLFWAGMPDRPDLLVAANGQVVAVRGPEGQLMVSAQKRDRYVEERWLERDGDTRKAAAIRNGQGFSCDGEGYNTLSCVHDTKGRRVAITHHPAALQDDCAQADILVVTFASARPCRFQNTPATQLRIDRNDLKTKGAHAIFIQEPTVKTSGTPRTQGSSAVPSPNQTGQVLARQDGKPPDVGGQGREPQGAERQRVKPEALQSTTRQHATIRVITVNGLRGQRPWVHEGVR
ncbi:MAG: ComEC/Rec2 family competence protein [Pseudomonadota bacterium]